MKCTKEMCALPGLVLYVSVKRILINLTGFMGVPNSVRMLYKLPSRLGFSKPLNSRCHTALYSSLLTHKNLMNANYTGWLKKFFLLPVKIEVNSYSLYIAESKYKNQIALSATYIKEKELNSKLCL